MVTHGTKRITTPIRRLMQVWCWVRANRFACWPGNTFNDLVKFAVVQPHTAALGAVIDFNTLALCHQEVYSAKRAKQAVLLVG